MVKRFARVALTGFCVLFGTALLIGGLPTASVSADTGSNWTGQYWNNNSLTGNPVITRTDAAVNFNWALGSPDPAIPVDNFSARWTLTLAFNAGAYRFRAGADDGVRAFIDNNVIIDQWHDAPNGFQTYTTDVNLGAGNHTLRVEYYEKVANAGVLFDWTPISAIGAPLTPVASTPVPVTLRAEIRVDTANVRSDPSTNNPPIAQVYFGDQFQVTASNGSNTWYLIKLSDGRPGWIFRRNIYLYSGDPAKLPTSQAPVAPPAASNVQGVARLAMIVRDGPSRRNTQKIGALNVGESFQIIALSRNHAWVQITASGSLQGWVYVPYIKVTVGNLGSLPVHN